MKFIDCVTDGTGGVESYLTVSVRLCPAKTMLRVAWLKAVRT